MKNNSNPLLFVVFLFPISLFCQKELASSTNYKSYSSSLNNEFSESSTTLVLPINMKLNLVAKDKCITYKSMNTAGAVMTIFGSIFFVGGTAMLFISAGDNYEDKSGNKIGGLVIAGVSGVVVGGMALGGGIPLMIIGKLKSRKYCSGKESSYLSVGAHDNGLGMTLTF